MRRETDMNNNHNEETEPLILHHQEQELLDKEQLEKEENSYTHVLKYAGVFGGVQGLNILIGLVRNKLVALLLGPGGMGLMSLLTTTLNFISNSTSFGISFSAVKNISELFDQGSLRHTRHFVGVVRSWCLLAALLGMVVCVSLGSILSDYTFAWGDHTLHFMLLAPAVGMLAVTGGEMAILKGMRRLKSLAVIQLFCVIVMLLISVPVFYFFGESGIVPVIVAGAFVSMAAACHFTFRIFPYSIRHLWSHLSEGYPMVRLGIAFILAGVLGSGAEMLVRSYLNLQGELSTVGFYSSAYMLIITYTGMVFSAMETDYFPRLSAANNDQHLFCQAANRQAEVALLMVSPMLVGLIVALPLLIPMLYSHEFMPIVSMAQIATFAMYAKALSLPISYMPLAKGKSQHFMAMESLYDLMLVAGVVIGYHYGGLVGTGVALAAIHWIELGALIIFAHAKYGLQLSSPIIKYMSLQLPIGILAWASAQLFSGWLYWCASILFVSLSAIVSLYILHQKTSLWNALMERIHRRR